jgi:hypothetical protein
MASCVLLLALAGCKSTLPALVGTYSIQENGRLKEFVRVDRNGDKYFVSVKDGRKWLSPNEVSRVEEDDLQGILNEPISANINALGNDTMAVVQVNKGWKLGNFESKTGYLLASSLGPVELYKSEAPEGQQSLAGSTADFSMAPNSR